MCKYRLIIVYVNIFILEDSVIDILRDFFVGFVFSDWFNFFFFSVCCIVVGKVYIVFFFYN